jgi:hypothetical protein
MGKYDALVSELKNVLPQAKNILIALPKGSDIDRFAAGLSLYLSFEDQGKQVSIVTEDTIRVAQANLFGIDHVSNTVAQSGAGNFILTLAGVAAPDPSGVGGRVPSLEKLDYFVEGSNLNLVFNVLPGQTFAPTAITPRYQGAGYDVIFTIGSASLIDLGNIYSANASIFQGPHIVNIDNETDNVTFGKTNVVDSSASSLSEIMTEVITTLGLPFDGDMGSNLLTGIFSATANLQNERVSADTYLVVSTCLRVGGKKPNGLEMGQPTGQGLDLSAFMPPTNPSPTPVNPSASFTPQSPTFMQPTPNTPTTQQALVDNLFNPTGSAITPPQSEFTMPPVINGGGSPERPSAEERPSGEAITSEGETEAGFEPGWLTPKVFKGTSVG